MRELKVQPGIPDDMNLSPAGEMASLFPGIKICSLQRPARLS